MKDSPQRTIPRPHPCIPPAARTLCHALEALQGRCGTTGSHHGSCTCSFLQLMHRPTSQAAGQQRNHLHTICAQGHEWQDCHSSERLFVLFTS